MNPRCFTVLMALIATLAITPAFSQDESSLSDEGLRQELDRFSSHRYSNSQRRGYRNRVTASDYELEFQMQQIDKRMAEDDHARANLITQEMGRRNAAREQARRALAEQRERVMQKAEDYWKREREETRQNSSLPTLPTLTNPQ